MTATELDRALATPEAVFAHPAQVLSRTDCTHEEKVAILQNWQRMLVQLQVATEENMMPDAPGRSNVAEPLAEVTRALTALGRTGDVPPADPS
jgi:putative ribosome biogenesis GTPase RsgA